ncbi:MAG: glycosyl hydrolase [Planctomycetota bacterium]
MRFLISTRKGLFRLERRRDGWHLGEPRFLGVPVLNAKRDARDGSIWACAGHGHWGAKLYVSHDDGENFEERPCPAFPEGTQIDEITEWGQRKEAAVVKHLYTIEPVGDAGRYLIGCDPGGLFESRDGGETWAINEPLWTLRNDHNWFEGGGGVMLHTVCVDPRDADRMHVAVSCAGVYETRDGGRSWTPRNQGVRADFLPDPHPEYGQDTHMLRRGTQDPDVLWQQNHCGNFRSSDAGAHWVDVSDAMPHSIGFCLALDEADDRVAWTVPMLSDEVRVAPDGALAVARSEDGGASWQEMRNGLPQAHCYDIVFRHAMDAREGTVAFGTNSGSLFVSENRGSDWSALQRDLPTIYAVSCES